MKRLEKIVTTKVQKWGNSLAVRIPHKTAADVRFKVGSPVTIAKGRSGLVIKKIASETALTYRDWKKYLIPMRKGKPDNVSERVDEIVYGLSRR